MIIDKNEAPDGYIAVEPINYSNKGVYTCDGCSLRFNDNCKMVGGICTSDKRKDKCDVIFKKKEV